MNTKRALKTLAKMNSTIYYQVINSELTLVSDTHAIFTIYTSEWEELKDVCFKHNSLVNGTDLLKLLREFNSNKKLAVRTSIVLDDDDNRDLVVYKYINNNACVRFRTVNRVYLDILNDLQEYNTWSGASVAMNNRNYNCLPVINVVDAYDTFYGGWAIMPVNYDVEGTLKKVLGI